MMKDRNSSYAVAGFYFCLIVIAYLAMSHTYFWFFRELADGGHVSGDFLEAGTVLDLPERIAGFLTAGIPLALFCISLYQLTQLFRRLKSNPVQISRHLRISANFALFGAVTLIIYPTVLSFLFIAMNSMEQNIIVLSIEPFVFVLFISSLLFFLLAQSIQIAFHGE